MRKNSDNLDEIYQKLQEKEKFNFKKWNESLISKIILLLPIISFLITFLIINSDQSILDLISFIIFGCILVSLALCLNFFLKNKF